MRAVGIDIGGSGVRAARVANGHIVGTPARLVLEDRSVETVLRAVATLVGQLGGADCVGAGMPGFLREGVVLASPNFPDWRDVDLRGLIAERLSVGAVVENDANAATIGAARHFGLTGDVVMVTLGTGVGGGVITDGRLLRGTAGTAGELGHTFVGGDRRCNCGGIGCLEQYCSTTGLLRSAEEAGRPCEEGRHVVDAARRGEPWATAILEDAAEKLGVALCNFVNMFAPDVLVIAGGLSKAEDLLAERALSRLMTYGIPANVARVAVRWVGPADTLAIVGSGMLALEQP